MTMAAKGIGQADSHGLEEFFKLTIKMSMNNMFASISREEIKKYNSLEEIVEDLYPVCLLCLPYYQKRTVRHILAN